LHRAADAMKVPLVANIANIDAFASGVAAHDNTKFARTETAQKERC
jgi:hypothetical protein